MNKNATMFLKMVLTAVLIGLFGFFITQEWGHFKKFLSANPIAQHLQIEHRKVKNKAIMMTINHYRPDLTRWKDFVIVGKELDQSFLNDSVRYYDVISSSIPQIAEPHFFLGVCYFLLGDQTKALAAQERAIVLEPRYFWSWYNLGMMFYAQGEFAKSGQAFRKALTLSPQTTVKIMGSSMIYGEVMRGSGANQDLSGQHLQQGYRDAAKMLEASVRRLRGQPPGIKESDVVLKVF